MEREELSRMLAAGHSLRATAQAMRRAPSTLVARADSTSRLFRHLSCGPGPSTGAALGSPPEETPETGAPPAFAQRWSPEQIAHRLPQRYPNEPTMRISHEAIYTYLYVLPCGGLKRELARYLRRRHRFRRPHKVRLSSRPIQDLISIDERPAEVADHTVPGHWERDLLVGQANASALGTLVERTTRFTLLVPLTAKDALTVRQAFARALRTLPAQLRRSLTYDQGPEMREHRLFTKQTKMRVYFAHPHSPWERGTNENTNGLLRQFFPKGTRFHQLSRTEIKRVQVMFNDRPRKILNWHSPAHAFHHLLR